MAAGTIRIGDLEVNRLGFGAMRITGHGIWGPPRDRDEAIRVLRRAVELGANLIDTADSYGPDVSEELIAEALAPYRDDVVIATKGGLVRPSAGEWVADGRPEHLREACEGSLRKLRLERIDVYQLHRPDPDVPFEESVGALKELRDEGKIRHVGLSNVTVEQLERAEAIVPIVSVQNQYNAEDRFSEDVLQACEQRGIPFLPWWPLGAGKAASPVDALVDLLRHSPVMLPIPGTSSVAHLEENMRAAELA
ncbi:MAG TPA: aldo/keto reductase [Gaiellaceae bacterium]|jgi:aryl-alcohol dehydrogenase-like predicted oxidoreductase|nr:aldo/keto reductase [Gaiellaceae bacterium]